MAGDWIKMRSDLLTHPKVVRIMSALKADKLRVIGGLHAVWCLFDMHSSDGMLEGYNAEILDAHLGWPGFSVEMARIGWLEIKSDRLVTPRFDEHNGQSAKRRAQEAERKRMARAEADLSALEADEKRTREEKRREEKKEVTQEQGANAPAPKFSKPSASDLLFEFAGKVGNPQIEASKFLAYYESNGWKVGRNPMKNWKSSAAGWAARSNDHAGNKSSARPSKSESNADAFHSYIAALDAEETLGNGLAGALESQVGIGPDRQY
jgi:hypothetical protein